MESMDVYKSFDFEFCAIMHNDRRTIIHQAKVTVQTQEYYYSCTMLEKLPNILELKSALILQWKVEKWES